MKFFWCFFVTVLVQKVHGFPYTFVDPKEYYQMPPLYKFDDYEECYGKFDNSPFCIVHTYIKPDQSSQLYNFIKNFSSSIKQHYRHDKIQRGICLETCKQLIDDLGNDSEKFYVEEFPMDSKLTFDFIRYYKVKYYRDRYNRLLNKCVNVELMRQYNLSGYSSIEYCIEKDSSIPFDAWDFLFLSIFCLMTTIVICSSLYDRYLKNSKDKKTDEHYKMELSSQSQRLLAVFSIRRNWHQLTTDTKSEFRDLRFLGALRTLTLFGVIIGHCAWYVNFIPSINPIFVEDMFNRVESMLIINGLHIVQTFFAISGFLNSMITLTYLDKAGKKAAGLPMLLKSIIGRYLRLAPLVALFVLLHATWMYRIYEGPFWPRISEPERQFCRDNWWQSLLFVNNYLNGDEICLIQTWYLAADFHLSILGTICIIMIVRHPKLKYFLFPLILGLSVFICGYVTYVNKLEPLTVFSPESLRNQLARSSEDEKSYFALYYSPTHTNLGVYFIGLAVGIYYFNLKKSNSEIKVSNWGRVTWYLAIVAGFATIFSAYIFYVYDFEKPSLLIALASTVSKHIWGFILMIVVAGIVTQYGWFIPNIFNYPVFRILGRISFCSFMVHLFLIKLVMGGSHFLLDLNVATILSYCVAVLFVSNCVGLALTLALDIPINIICKMIFGGKSSKVEAVTSQNLTSNHQNGTINRV